MLTGEAPEVNPEVARAARLLRPRDFVSYVVWACERALERGLLPHTNLGVLSRADLARLREVTASQGLMLESVSERLMETVHAGSPTKHPARRLETIETAGELRIPFTSGILVGIGETEDGAGRLARGARRGPRPPRPHPGGDPPELRPAPAVLRGARSPRSPTRRRGERWAAGQTARTAARRLRGMPSCPRWASEVTLDDMKRLVADARRLMPDVGIQIPPNLSDWWVDLVEAGRPTSAGSRPTATTSRPSTPSRARTRSESASRPRATRSPSGSAPTRSTWSRSGSSRACSTWSSSSTGASSRGAARGGAPSARSTPSSAPRAIERGRAGEALTEDELTALFAETRPEVIE